jgi:hypothetical protein
MATAENTVSQFQWMSDVGLSDAEVKWLENVNRFGMRNNPTAVTLVKELQEKAWVGLRATLTPFASHAAR